MSHKRRKAMSLPGYGPHRPASLSQRRQRRSTLVPSGFECVAHPIFFRVSGQHTPVSAAPPMGVSAAAERRRLDATSTPTTTISQTAAAAWDVEALGKGGKFGAGDLRGAAAGKGDGGIERGEEREVDAVCPICLDKFERPVTLTSCLHSFCHTCILGWYEHTVAVALSQGNLSAFQSERGAPTNSTGNSSSSSGSNSSSGGKRPAPYRCPLCQVPGPFFLSGGPAKPNNNNKNNNVGGDGKNNPSKLKFRLLGARTVFGGGGPTTGGLTVDEHAGDGGEKAEDGGGSGYPSPTMSELRAAVRIQLALAAAAQGSGAGEGPPAKKKSRPPCSAAGKKREGTASVEGGGRGDSSSERASPRTVGGDQEGDIRRLAGGGRTSSSRSGSRDYCASASGSEGGDEGGEGESHRVRRRERSRRQRDVDLDRRSDGAASGDAGLRFRQDRSPSPGRRRARHDSAIPGAGRERRSSGSAHHNSYSGDARDGRSRRKRKLEGRGKGGKKRKSRDRASGRRSSRDFSSPSGGGGSSSGAAAGGSGGRLPWEPGALVAEDGLALIEAILEREKESLRRKTTGAGDPPL